MNMWKYNFRQIFDECKSDVFDVEDRSFTESLASAIYERFQQDDPDLTTWPEAVVKYYACYDLQFQVGNGGFAQAAYNAPDLFPIALEAYEQLGSTEGAAIIREAISMLPEELQQFFEKGILETDSIDDVFEHFDESPMAELDDRTPDDFWNEDKLHAYALANRAEFEKMDGIG